MEEGAYQYILPRRFLASKYPTTVIKIFNFGRLSFNMPYPSLIHTGMVLLGLLIFLVLFLL
jgi:ABC-type phosphate transport system permease subunit